MRLGADTFQIESSDLSDRSIPTPYAKGVSEHTFQGQHSARRIHQGGVGGDRATERLVRHRHVNDHHTVLRRRLPHANVFIGLHRHMCKCDELLVNPEARQLHCNIPFSHTISTSSNVHSIKLHRSTSQQPHTPPPLPTPT